MTTGEPKPPDRDQAADCHGKDTGSHQGNPPGSRPGTQPGGFTDQPGTAAATSVTAVTAAIGSFGPAARRLAGEALHQAGAVDRAVYDTIAAVPTPALDAAMRRLSSTANHSVLWLAIAAGLSLTGPRGRRAAARGVLAIGVTSAIVNLAVKPLSTRHRPDREGAGVPGERRVSMPSSTSFPSGHSASAFAFATAVSRDNPWIAIVIQFLAGAVAYSRVHTGVHYPGDTIAGALIGAGAGQAVSSVFDRALGSRPKRRALFCEQVVGCRVRVEFACRHSLGQFIEPRLAWQPAKPSPDVGHRYRGNLLPRPRGPALLPQP